METSSKKEAKRNRLRELSLQARAIRDAKIQEAETPDESFYWSSRTLNSIIIENFYKSSEHQIFKTFKEWINEGLKVKKGSTGFVVWGKKMKAQDKTAAKESGNPEDEREFKFFPISHVFSNSQVETLKN